MGRHHVANWIFVAACLAIGMLTGCRASRPTTAEGPAHELPLGDPGDHGFALDRLQQSAQFAQQTGADCFLVVRHDVLVGRWYWGDYTPHTPRPVFSVSKSVTATAVGIAQDEGLLSIEDKVSRYVPEWRGTASEDVTIRNLLSNDSGRFWSFPYDYQVLPTAKDQTQVAIDLPGVADPQPHPPGTHWEYNNCAIQVLERVLSRATGMPAGQYIQRRLLDPLGIHGYSVDWAHNALLAGGLYSTCEGLARFGVMALHGGDLGSQQLVSRQWIDAATSPSTTLNAAYGFLWWVNAEGDYRTPTLDRPPITGHGRLFGNEYPQNVFMAMGLFDQIVAIVPDEQLVYVRIGRASGDRRFAERLLDAVYGALER